MLEPASATLPIPPVLQPLRIEVGSPNTPGYKSIDYVVWDDIPPLAVLTGLNGSGKTQLLELLALKLTGAQYPPGIDEIPLTVSGDTFGPDAIGYLPSHWEVGSVPPMDVATMLQAKSQLYESVKRQNILSDISRRATRARLERVLDIPDLDRVGVQQFSEKLPDDFSFMLSDMDVMSGLTHVFVAYRLRAAQELERGVSIDDIPQRIGPAPWDVANQIFQAAEFPYRVNSPMEGGLLDTYFLRLREPGKPYALHPHELSSGEKMLLALVMWLYNSQHHARFPKLLILDEPDAHLHPSMTRHFIRVIQEVLVERYGVRTILSTHSPSTVALAPEGSVFEMARTPPRIRRSPSKAQTVGLLTAGLVTVSPASRFVLVEDASDVSFFSTVRDILTDYGPSRDTKAIEPSPTIVFLPASTGTSKDKIGGGSTVVTSWVAKFDQAPLEGVFRGLIDRDAYNTPSDRVCVLSRYSIENYLLDPFVVFGELVDHNVAPWVQGVTVTPGEAHRLREMSETQLQAIVAVIASTVEPELVGLTPPERALKSVTFTNGKVVQYPAWMIDWRGHDLIPMYQRAFGGPGLISPPRLLKSLRRVRLIPQELAAIFTALQA
jgi:ABC-type Mn2+/Zn2+ transport system ATPase subunit